MRVALNVFAVFVVDVQGSAVFVPRQLHIKRGGKSAVFFAYSARQSDSTIRKYDDHNVHV